VFGEQEAPCGHRDQHLCRAHRDVDLPNRPSSDSLIDASRPQCPPLLAPEQPLGATS